MPAHRESSWQLYDFAGQQESYFTTKQARAAGFAENTHACMWSQGRGHQRRLRGEQKQIRKMEK
jgi:hypothetical protein